MNLAFLGWLKMDDVSDKDYEGALVIVVEAQLIVRVLTINAI